MIIEEKGLEEVSIIKTPLEKQYDRDVQDELMSYLEEIHNDDAPYIGKSVMHTSTWSGKLLPFVIDDDSPLRKLSEPPKPNLKPFLGKLKYAFLGDYQTCPFVIPSSISNQLERKVLDFLRKQREAFGWTILELKGINTLVCQSNIYYDEDYSGGIYLIDFIVDEVDGSHMRSK